MSIYPFSRVCIAGLLVPVLLYGCTMLLREDFAGRIFRGEAEFGKLERALRRSPLASECPQPAIGQVSYELRNFPDEEVEGKEGYVVVERVQGIAGLAMASSGHKPQGLFSSHAWPSSAGRVLSCGGLFTLAYREQRTQKDIPLTRSPLELPGLAEENTYHEKLPNRRYEVQQINEYNGGLFPLKVGNELAFTYTALLQSRPTRKGYADIRFHERVQYRVLSVNDSFRMNGKPVAGNVYLIERVQSRDAGRKVSKRDYYYSDELGWVVMEVEYDNDTPVSVMEMTGWN